MHLLNHPLFYIAVFGCIFFEYFISRRKKINNFSSYETFSNLVFMGIDKIIVVFTGTEGGPLGTFLWEHRWVHLPESSRPLTLFYTFFAAELMYYMVHYYNHFVNIGWATHIMHHTPTKYNLTLAHRVGLTRFISLAWLMIIPLILLGFHPADLAWWAAITLIGQFFIHTELVGKLGVLDLFLNTPSNHRVHHSSNPDHYNKNLGGLTMMFDHLFGTYCAEPDRVTMKYGISSVMAKKSIMEEILWHWKTIWKRFKFEKGFKRKTLVLFGSASRAANTIPDSAA